MSVAKKKYTWVGLSVMYKDYHLVQEIRMLIGLGLNECIRIVKDQEFTTRPARNTDHDSLLDLLKKYCFGVRVEELEGEEV